MWRTHLLNTYESIAFLRKDSSLLCIVLISILFCWILVLLLANDQLPLASSSGRAAQRFLFTTRPVRVRARTWELPLMFHPLLYLPSRGRWLPVALFKGRWLFIDIVIDQSSSFSREARIITTLSRSRAHLICFKHRTRQDSSVFRIPTRPTRHAR